MASYRAPAVGAFGVAVAVAVAAAAAVGRAAPLTSLAAAESNGRTGTEPTYPALRGLRTTSLACAVVFVSGATSLAVRRARLPLPLTLTPAAAVR